MTTPVLSDAFVDAMKRAEARRSPEVAPQPKRPLLRRSGLVDPDLPHTSFAVMQFLGWLWVIPWKSEAEIRKELGWKERET